MAHLHSHIRDIAYGFYVLKVWSVSGDGSCGDKNRIQVAPRTITSPATVSHSVVTRQHHKRASMNQGERRRAVEESAAAATLGGGEQQHPRSRAEGIEK